MSTIQLPSGKRIFDPFADEKPTSVSSTDALESSSASMDNSTEGQCPKCKGTMGTALAAKNETVYYCTTCRVSSPFAL